MSEENKGKKGEAQLLGIFSTIMEVEANVDVVRGTFTNEPDNGVDLKVKAPHNIAEKFKDILEDNEKKQVLSNTKILIRIDHKEYEKPIGKAVVDKFVGDIEKNPEYAEHWLTGGPRLTNGAEKVLKNASKPCRYYSSDDINKLKNYYKNELENDLDVED